MRKYYLRFIFIVAIGFVFLNSVSASENYKYSCTYRNKNDNSDQYTLTYETAGNEISVVDCKRGKESCFTNANEFVFDYKITPGRKTCILSIDVEQTTNGLKFKWIKNGKGQYIYGPQWECEYKTSDPYPETLYIKYEWVNNQFAVTDYEFTSEIEFSDEGDINWEGLEDIDDEFELQNIDESTNIGGESSSTNIEESSNLSVITKMDTYSKYKNKCVPIEFDFNGVDQIIKFKLSGDSYLVGDQVLSTKLKSFTQNRTTATKLGVATCIDFTKENDCISDDNYACVWVENKAAPNGGFCNVDKLLFVGCGGASDIPVQVPALISFAVNLLKIATPIILIFISILTLLKALAAGKDDEIKKAQSSLVKKMIAAALVFFIVGIVQFVVSKVADDDSDYDNFTNCLSCFLNNKCEKSTYYKTVISGKDWCTSLTTGSSELCNPEEK